MTGRSSNLSRNGNAKDDLCDEFSRGAHIVVVAWKFFCSFHDSAMQDQCLVTSAVSL
uniref:Uncharacterized protein n=1 Tax=Arundo donax TaxID=35708 RepID=A0A0A8ZLX4_ARUDO